MGDIRFTEDQVYGLIYKLKQWKEKGIHSIDLEVTTMFLEEKLKEAN